MSDTSVLRRFNRTYTQRVGALEDSFLGMGLPLGTARILYELGAGPTTVRELRARLGLDSGYVARQLRVLEQRVLVQTTPDPDDRRRRLVRLTRRGRAAWTRLDDRSERLATRLLEPLTERQRDRLTAALATADLLVRAATVSLREVDPRSADAVAAVSQYFAELDRRFPAGFDLEAGLAEDSSGLAGPGARFVLATSDGVPVACGGLRELEPGVAEIKRMWVHEAWRGAGLGSRLLRHLEELAAELGHRVLRLDTHAALTDAIALYEREGYRRIPRYNDNPDAEVWFEKRLTPRPRRGSAESSR